MSITHVDAAPPDHSANENDWSPQVTFTSRAGAAVLHAHFDCFSGAAGDMLLAACVDAMAVGGSGSSLTNLHKREAAAQATREKVVQHISRCITEGMPPLRGEFRITCERVWRGSGSIAATYVKVHSIYGSEGSHMAAAPVPTPSLPNPSLHSNNSSAASANDTTRESDHSRRMYDHSETLAGHSHTHEHDAHHHNHDHSHSHEHRGSSHSREYLDHSHEHHGSETQPDPAVSRHGPLRNLRQIRDLLENAPVQFIPPWVQQKAIEAFTVLAQAESVVHGTADVDAVHFHEVGAVDSIVDTVGTLLALYFLGVTTVSSSRLPLGEGRVRTAHGILPVPAPATLCLLLGMPTTSGPPGTTGELVTPTGAALLRVLTSVEGGLVPNRTPPNFTLQRFGSGAGTKDFPGHPNIVRVLVGKLDVDFPSA